MDWTPRDTRFALLAGLAGLALYLPALTAGFVSDDFQILRRVEEQHGLRGLVAYFSMGFYDYYRPMAFVSHAVDWSIWGTDPAGFHLTNVLLHAANSALVFVAGRRIAGRGAAFAGALVFGVHPVASEAVFWIAARFDLLATCFGLIALAALQQSGARWLAAGAIAFLLAVLSKESAAALPVAAAAHDAFWKKLPAGQVARRLVPLAAALLIYGALRAGVADLPITGAAGRTGKVVMLAVATAAILAVSGRPLPGGRAITAWRAAGLGLFVAGASTIAAIAPLSSRWTTGKLTFASYAAFHLTTPVVVPAPPPFFLDPSTRLYWVLGVLVVLAATVVVLRCWAAIVRSPAGLTLAGFITAALIPVTTMTGGTRYLYLASIGTALFVGRLVAGTRPRWATAAKVCLAAFLAISVAQVIAVSSAWRWAGSMTRDAAAVLAPLAQPCGAKSVLLVTAPVNIRGVYSNINDDVFAVLARCPKVIVRALTRLVRLDASVEPIDEGAGRVAWRVTPYVGNVVVSRDLREFDMPLRAVRHVEVDTPVGRLESFEEGPSQRFRLTIGGAMPDLVLAYYSDGRVRPWPKALD
jgi:hypothetical protein